ncbi:MAG TPA: SGNH/GDSL hydrolase family protein [Anaerolineae bacterium]|nr:SGNH/GDSL hydrolase family protein [Anaerolineae bacterium]HQI84291.1 SGNH/GDSL hydrolase family protein [Anaerolineae bacterium]
MSPADQASYLADIVAVLKTHWPDNRTINIVCHGHSVPAGYFATPLVDALHAYPHLLFRGLKQRFPFAVLNVIVTARGGEESDAGATRFAEDALCHKPDVVTLDYGLNDRRIGLGSARIAWRTMIEQALARGCKVILLTPTHDVTQRPTYTGDDCHLLAEHAAQIRDLAAEYGLGLADSFAAFQRYEETTGPLDDLLSWGNHPNRKGHKLVVTELLRWFPAA